MPGVVAIRYCVALRQARPEPTQGDLVARERRARQLSNIIKRDLHRHTDFMAGWLFEQGHATLNNGQDLERLEHATQRNVSSMRTNNCTCGTSEEKVICSSSA